MWGPYWYLPSTFSTSILIWKLGISKLFSWHISCLWCLFLLLKCYQICLWCLFLLLKCYQLCLFVFYAFLKFPSNQGLICILMLKCCLKFKLKSRTITQDLILLLTAALDLLQIHVSEGSGTGSRIVQFGFITFGWMWNHSKFRKCKRKPDEVFDKKYLRESEPSPFRFCLDKGVLSINYQFHKDVLSIN